MGYAQQGQLDRTCASGREAIDLTGSPAST
jgi:hypothetical protein